MLITVSGMVGSGKSTTAAAVVELLAGAGLKPRYLRFRYLGLLGFETPRSRGSSDRATDGVEVPRGSRFMLRRLTAAVTAGYAVRILAFRLSGVGAGSRCDVLDRYFYDNFVHYELTSRRERLYARFLRRLIPAPDAAILLLASDRAIAERRRKYAHEYLVTVAKRYEELTGLFPHLVCIRTDAGGSTSEEIRRAMQPLIDLRRSAPRVARNL